MEAKRRGSSSAPRSRVVVRLTVTLAVAAASATAAVGVASAGVPTTTTPYVAGGGVGPDGVPGTPCSRTARACVDLGSHNAWLIEDGQVTRSVTFVDGDEEDPTPTGTFSVEWKAQNYTSREYGTPMPFSVFFAPGGVAFHEGSQKTPSAGCVKLVRDDAVAFFNDLQVGDEVQVK